MRKMTNEERKLVEENMGIAYKMAWDYAKENIALMHKLNWTLEDVQSEAMLALCLTVQRHDPDKGGLSTLMMYVFKHQMFQKWRSANCGKHCGEIGSLSLDRLLDGADRDTFCDVLVDGSEDTERSVIARDTFDRAFRAQSERNQRVVQLYAAGRTQAEIAARTGMTQAMVSRVIRRFIEAAV